MIRKLLQVGDNYTINIVAGADISEMAKKDFETVYKENYLSSLENTINSVSKPIIAAVSGYAVSCSRKPFD